MPLDLLPDDVQRAIVDAAADLLDPVAAAASLRTRGDGPVRDAKVWEKAAAQGWFGLAVPEDAGGLGLGAGELALVHQHLGRTLTPGPYLGTTLAAIVGRDGGTTRPVGILLGDGSIGARVSGTFRTDDREDAEAWLALSPAGAALLPAGSGPVGSVTVVATPDSMDPAARPAQVTVDQVADVHLDSAEPWTLATVLVAAQLAGIAQAAVAASVAHVSVREQFGRPIGAFQMVQQRCADMATRADAATQLTLLAALSVQPVEKRPESVSRLLVGSSQLAASALLVAGNAAIENARDDIQNHGGMGFTWEVDSHLRLRRAHGLRALLGDPADLRADVLEGPSARAW